MRYSEYVGDYSREIEGEVDEVIEVLKYLEQSKEINKKKFDKQLEGAVKIAENHKPEMTIEDLEKEVKRRMTLDHSH